MFENKTVLITGGTGSLGTALTKRLLKSGVSKIRIFSRNESKQVEMESEINDENFRPSYNVTLVAYIIDNSSDNLGNLNISKEGKITISADLFGNKFKKGEGKFGFYNIEIEY